MADIDRAIAEIATRQHGLVSVAQATELGMTPRMRQRRFASGLLLRTDPLVLRVPGAPMTYESSVMAAVLAAGPGALASHRTAAVLWGLEGFRPGIPEVTIPRGRRYRRDGVVSHESTDLDRTSPGVRAGIPVTEPSRTLLDVALRSSDRRLLQAIESGRRFHLTTWPELIATLATHARRGRPGVQRLRRVIAANVHRDEITDSAFELLVIALLAEHGAPTPLLHHRVLAPDGRFLAEVDLAYPSIRLAVELDGKVHLQADVWERDRPRQNRLELLGWTVLRFTWRTFVNTPELIVAEVLEAHRRGARQAG